MGRGYISMNDDMKIRELTSDKVWDYENGYYWFSDQTRFEKFIAHYECYKSISMIPGDIVECGVFKACSLIRWATFRAMLNTNTSRQIIGFDAFGKFPRDHVASKDDRDFINRFEEDSGDGLDQDEIQKVLLRKGISHRTTLVPGNVFHTIPRFLSNNPELRISLLHLDMDVYEPTDFALNQFWPFMVRGGLVVVDDYGTVAGATQAIDEFFDENRELRLERHSMARIPAFFRKP
jgi:hypothetical protein